MLARLEDIHAQLRDAIAALAELTRQSDPDVEALSAARLQLSRLSRRRRMLIDCSILPLLDDAAAIANLAADAAEQGVRSSEHVGRWTLSAICSAWPHYQLASATMRREMLRRIEREAAILYPLLRARLHHDSAHEDTNPVGRSGAAFLPQTSEPSAPSP